jgi:hypothetical protein
VRQLPLQLAEAGLSRAGEALPVAALALGRGGVTAVTDPLEEAITTVLPDNALPFMSFRSTVIVEVAIPSATMLA